MRHSKPFALLVYLAVATPRGFHRRDTLTGLLWADSEMTRARNSLSVAKHRLQRALGEVLRTRGDELGLAWDVVRCDVVAFEEALDEGQLEEALELYRGDLLPGLYVSDALEWEHWLERERDRLRERARQAAWEIAERAEEANDIERATHWARRALLLAADDERALRRLITLLDGAGDRASALREYESFARRLEQEYELRPSPETQALVAAVQARSTTHVPTPVLARPSHAGDDPSASSPAVSDGSDTAAGIDSVATSDAPPPGRTPASRVSRFAGIAALVALLMAAAVWWNGHRAPDTPRSAYKEGEMALRQGRYHDAVAAFRSALLSDSTQALTYYNLSLAANWTGDARLSSWASEQAYERRDQLPPLARQHVVAWHAYSYGDPVTAERLYLDLVSRDSTDSDAWFQLGETLFHWGPMRGRPASESRLAWEHVLRHQPENAGARFHLLRLAADERDRVEYDRIAEGLETSHDGSQYALEQQALRAFTFGTETEQRQALRLLGGASDEGLRNIASSVAAHSGNPDAVADLLLPLVLSRYFSPTPERALQYLVRAQVEAERGKLRRAQVWVDSAMPEHRGRAQEYRAMLLTLPFAGASAAELRATRGLMADTLPRGPGDYRASAWRFYLAGLISLRLGELDAIEPSARALDRLTGEAQLTVFTHELARQLRAEAARARGNPAAALATLGEKRLQPFASFPEIISYPLAHDRWLRAELLRESGNPRQALRMYATFPDPGAYDLMYLAPAHLRQAEIHEQLGEHAEAIEHYRRGIQLWKNADPALQPWVEHARLRLAQLETEAGIREE